ncbi:MAG: response regulator [Bacteroidota bacterium]|nr:response regulator [Bacteroidota bacterium]
MKILVIDDDRMMQESISYTLKNEGYDVILADDGYVALDMIDKQKFDLIISDILMPNLSGLGLLSLLKQFYFNRIPVILISSLNKADVIAQSLGLGAVAFITKPFTSSVLCEKIRQYIQKKSA